MRPGRRDSHPRERASKKGDVMTKLGQGSRNWWQARIWGVVTVASLAFVAALAISPLVPSAAASTTYFAAPTGSDAITCAANSHANPLATIQAALACTTDGDVVSLAPSGGTPYPGVGAVTHNVTIEAEAGANARTVTVDVSPTPGPMSIPGGTSATVEGVTLACEVGLDTGFACGSNVTNHGTLVLRRDTVK